MLHGRCEAMDSAGTVNIEWSDPPSFGKLDPGRLQGLPASPRNDTALPKKVLAAERLLATFVYPRLASLQRAVHQSARVFMARFRTNYLKSNSQE